MLILLNLLESIIKLGLPMAGLSWFLFARMYNSGDVHRDADRKAIKSQLQSVRTKFKADKKVKVKDDTNAKAKLKSDIVFDKWMWFGSGFYGLAALWTFVIIEITDVFNFIFNNPGWAVLLADGVVSLVFDVLANQISNIVSAFVWFSFWDVGSIWLLVLIAYAGYWLGIEAARRETEFPVASWKEKLREFLQSLKS